MIYSRKAIQVLTFMSIISILCACQRTASKQIIDEHRFLKENYTKESINLSKHQTYSIDIGMYRVFQQNGIFQFRWTGNKSPCPEYEVIEHRTKNNIIEIKLRFQGKTMDITVETDKLYIVSALDDGSFYPTYIGRLRDDDQSKQLFNETAQQVNTPDRATRGR